MSEVANPISIADSLTGRRTASLKRSIDPDFYTNATRRRRARLQVSESSSSDSSDAGTFEISSVRYRVGAPPLHKLPLRTNPIDTPAVALIRQTFGYTLLREVIGILQAEHVTLADPTRAEYGQESVKLVSREIPDAAMEGTPTVLITADWRFNPHVVWELAVRRIKKAVDKMRLRFSSAQGIDITVEIVTKELVMEKFMSIIPRSYLELGLDQDWPVIQYDILDIMDKFEETSSHFTSMSIFKLGLSKAGRENTNTVYITVDYESNESKWGPILDEV